MKKHIDVWHLEIADASQLQSTEPARPYDLRRLETPLPEFNRFLYIAVGAPWCWYMRLDWNYSQWQAFLQRPGVETWVAYSHGTPAGYFEIEKQAPDSAEIAYFGLLGEFIGQGLGGALLEDAIHAAWQLGGRRVWLHTCSLDHPNALANYKARGFRVFRQESIVEDIPDNPIQPWPRAGKYPTVS